MILDPSMLEILCCDLKVTELACKLMLHANWLKFGLSEKHRKFEKNRLLKFGATE